MASFTFTEILPTFPEGTEVEAYAASNWPFDSAPSGSPRGEASAEAEVEGGNLEFTGLSEGIYYAYAQVNGQDRYTRFQIVPAASSGGGSSGIVEFVDVEGDYTVQASDAGKVLRVTPELVEEGEEAEVFYRSIITLGDVAIEPSPLWIVMADFTPPGEENYGIVLVPGDGVTIWDSPQGTGDVRKSMASPTVREECETWAVEGDHLGRLISLRKTGASSWVVETAVGWL